MFGTMNNVNNSLSEITSVASSLNDSSTEDIGFEIGRKLSGFGLGGDSIGASLGLGGLGSLSLGDNKAFASLHNLMAKCEACELK